MKLEYQDMPEGRKYIFITTHEEMANCEFDQKILSKLAKLETEDSVAAQLELLVEYFYKIEGKDRVTTLAQYLKNISDNYKFAQNNFNQNNASYSTIAYAPFRYKP